MEDEADNLAALSGQWIDLESAATHIVAGFDQSITGELERGSCLESASLNIHTESKRLSTSGQNGTYLEKCKVDNNAAQPYGKDEAKAVELGALSEELMAQKFEF